MRLHGIVRPGIRSVVDHANTLANGLEPMDAANQPRPVSLNVDPIDIVVAEEAIAVEVTDAKLKESQMARLAFLT